MLPFLVVALGSALVLTAPPAWTSPASGDPGQAGGVDEAADKDVAGGEHWPWTGAGTCPLYCTCYERQGARRADCVSRRLAGVDLALPTDTDVADLSYNYISSLPDSCFQKLRLVQLKQLVLRHNAIRAVGPWAFAGLRRLRYLDLSYNHLQMLYPNTFADNRGLKTLLLAGNNLARLPAEQPLATAPRLQVLDLSSCHLAHLGAAVLSELPALASLNLSDNSLIQLKPEALASQALLQVLDVTRNPLACDVNTRRLVQQLQAGNVTVRHSCPTAKTPQAVQTSRHLERLLADVLPDPGPRPYPQTEGVEHDEGPGVDVEVLGGFLAAVDDSGTRTHERLQRERRPKESVETAEDDDEELDVETTTARKLQPTRDCRTLFPKRNSLNPVFLKGSFDGIPSFWACVLGCQVGFALGLVFSSCLCRAAFWRSLCAGSPPRPRCRLNQSPVNSGWIEEGQGLATVPLWCEGEAAEAVDPCLLLESPTPRPETPPPSYNELVHTTRA